MFRFLSRSRSRAPDATASGPDSSSSEFEALASAYAGVVRDQFERAGIPGCGVKIEMACMGRAADGRAACGALVRLLNWEESYSPRLLLGLPLLESKVRRALEGHWLSDVSCFAGLWLHPSGTMLQRPVLNRVRELLHGIESSDSAPGRVSELFWTQSGDLVSEPAP